MAVAPAALTPKRPRNALLWSKEIRRLGPERGRKGVGSPFLHFHARLSSLRRPIRYIKHPAAHVKCQSDDLRPILGIGAEF